MAFFYLLHLYTIWLSCIVALEKPFFLFVGVISRYKTLSHCEEQSHLVSCTFCYNDINKWCQKKTAWFLSQNLGEGQKMCDCTMPHCICQCTWYQILLKVNFNWANTGPEEYIFQHQKPLQNTKVCIGWIQRDISRSPYILSLKIKKEQPRLKRHHH
jgi:hypothetical protein